MPHTVPVLERHREGHGVQREGLPVLRRGYLLCGRKAQRRANGGGVMIGFIFGLLLGGWIGFVVAAVLSMEED